MTAPDQKIIALVALSGLLSVIIGAGGDHWFALDDAQRHTFDTALRYQQLYTIITLALALKGLTSTAWIFLAGLSVFSGGLYVYLATGIKALAFVTPVGGLILMAGWAWLFVTSLHAMRKGAIQ